MSGINNVSVNNAVTGVIQEQLKVAENAQKKVSEETSSDNTASNPVDTVELSVRAQSRLNKISEAAATPTAEVRQAPRPAPARCEANSSDEEDEEASSTTNLVSLSETEMLEMVMEGSISRADMEAELARRGIAIE